MSEFKLRPTPSLIRPICEQLQANGVDVSQNTLLLQEPTGFMEELSEAGKEAQKLGGFLRGIISPLQLTDGFPDQNPKDNSVWALLKYFGIITAKSVDGKSDEVTLNLAELRRAAGVESSALGRHAVAARFVRPAGAGRGRGGEGIGAGCTD